MIPTAFAVESISGIGSASTLTIVLISLWVGRFLCTPLAGGVVARYDGIMVMIYADSVRIAAQGGLAIAILSMGHSTTLALAISAGVYGVATAFYVPASITMLPRLVRDGRLKDANSALSMVMDTAVLVGPAAAVILIHVIGFSGILLVDSVTFCINILGLIACRHLLHKRDSMGRRTSAAVADVGKSGDALGGGTDGSFLSVMREHTWLLAGLLLWAVVSVIVGVMAVSGPAAVIPRDGAGMWAVIATCMAVGSLAGSIMAVVTSIPWRVAGVVVGGAVGLQACVLALYGTNRAECGWVPLIVGFIVGPLVVTSTGIVWTTAQQSTLSHEALARFSSVEQFVTSAAVPIGMILAGLITSRGNSSALLLPLGVAVSVLGVWSLMFPRSLR
ncbi:MAG: hypothetical protein QM673_16235 [Gordonia sp. (in: high G+C Gram-positive bacteria)]